jgi:signal transduction histidine kinase
VIFGICLVALAIALNVGWILLNIREVALMIFGVIFFALIITGLTLNTIFLVREIRRNEQHDAFLNAVTHELKTPIASIRLYLETLKSREIDAEKRAEFYDIMLSDSDRLLGTVEQVLQASRTRENERRMELSEFNLGELVSETINMVRTRHHLAEGSIRLTQSAEPIELTGDRGELQTVFSNLLDNAVKYSIDEPKISVRTKASGGYGEVYIKDNGIGISAADLKRIFRRFYRANSRGGKAVKGTGLGLAIVQSVIAKHGGRVLAQSNGEGKGSTFVVRLPRN